eukprot:CAMPEP_0198360680 /NCGR_PEP_ID=MMETSP1450-20131203/139385_1 /TAXON_ID=753684 ORGANISM="Madagascaria erythrocladiodes, Strain CCMP3234" /NCGR_SAMPLE_ID=MMETSP1450 /ASSEMBLY_ACC=CAM_ASM_001115 /LENGTH=50 /DNA_ID=CAMNT_0044067707 /DNA_START=6 /DNA_END=154 /DNA_ORIENTATION=+
MKEAAAAVDGDSNDVVPTTAVDVGNDSDTELAALNLSPGGAPSAAVPVKR